MRRSALLRLTIAFIVTLVSTAFIPLPTPAVAQSTRNTLTFENGIDGTVIGATIPGVQFSNSSGADWFYGDVRTDRYNAPYPENCPDFGGICAYAVDGFGFAWMGEVAGVGRIDFVDANTTYFSADFSTAEVLTVSAYAADDTLLGSVVIAANLRTGRLDRAEISVPATTTIAYVLISGSGNRWLMDNLTTDATSVLPPRPPLPPEEFPEGPASAEVVVGVVVGPNITIAPGEIATLTIVVVNRGRGMAEDAVLELPFNPELLAVVDASFSSEDAWVSALATNSITIRTGRLLAYNDDDDDDDDRDDDGDTVTITLRLRVKAEVAFGVKLFGRITCSWDDRADDGMRFSNAPALVTGPQTIAADTLPLIVEADDDDSLRFSGDLFAPAEPVGVWYEGSDGVAVAVATISTNLDGVLNSTLDLDDLPAGSYTLIAQGIWSQVTLSSSFVVDDGSSSGS